MASDSLQPASMIDLDNPFPFNHLRTIVLVLCLTALGVLLWNTQSSNTTRLSRWGQMAGAAQSMVIPQNGIQGIAQVQSAPVAPGGIDPNLPWGNPFNVPNTVMTQGYGVGSHAPANVWGAIDLAIDSDGDGSADPGGTANQPIYATHAGAVTVTPNSVPAGNHIWIVNDSYRTGYSHLARFAVASGQTVQRGDLIGYAGSTGESSGPHLDYQVWQHQSNGWINLNPIDQHPFDTLK